MCTLSWRQDGSTLDVFFNRDEQKSRVAARPAHFWFIALYRETLLLSSERSSRCPGSRRPFV